MSEKEKIINTFSNLKIVVDIEVNDRNEDDEQDSGKTVIFRIKKEKNEDFFKLRDFFKASNETFDDRGITRYKYKKVLINKLYSYSSYIYRFLQAGDEIVLYGYSVDDFRTIKSYLNDFLSVLKFCYEQIFNQGSYEIKVDLN